jgi:hypothetical protein
LAPSILWDDDWIDAGFTARARKERLGIEDDYYQAIVPEPSESDPDQARQTLRDSIAGADG